MFNILIDKPPTQINGFPIRSDYRVMIMFESLLLDDAIKDADKIDLALTMFYETEISDISCAWDKMLWFYRGGEDAKESFGGTTNPRRLYDFEEEAGLIYTSFLTGHGIRLQETKMHWWEFRNLFFTLPKDTPMHDRLMYRSLDANEFKSAERKQVLKMQKLYALRALPVPPMTQEQKDKAYLDKMNKRYAEAKAKCRKNK